MMSLVFILTLTIAIIAGVISYKTYEYDDILLVVATISGIIAALSLITVAILGASLSKTVVVDEKIAMYEEENQRIEAQIDVAVSQYMAHEASVFAESKAESSITLVSLYPELKSDTLVQEQLKVYQINNAKIKKLRESKINAKVERWWLYFG